MINQPVITDRTAAVVTQALIPSANHYGIVIGANNLAGAEEVDIYVRVNETWVILADPQSGAPIKLTSTVPTQNLRGGPLYGVLKDATAGSCGVYWGPLSRVY